MITDPKLPMLPRITSVDINGLDYIKIFTTEHNYQYDMTTNEVYIGQAKYHTTNAYKKRFVRKAILWLTKIYTPKMLAR